MKIVKLEILKLSIPMIQSLSAGFGEINQKTVVIVKLYSSNGLIGYGEASCLNDPVYNPETTATCIEILKNHIAPRILNKELGSVEEFRSSYQDIVGNSIAKHSVECAFWHLTSMSTNRSLRSLFGGEKARITVGESIGIKSSVEDTLVDVEKYLNIGFERIKLKIKPGWDIQPLEAIRNKWPDINLSADGNSSYNLSEHQNILKQIDNFKLSMIEQPLAFDDFVDHAKLQKIIATPICLDESIGSLNDTKTAIKLGSCQTINIKPGRVGGILESLAINDLAAQHGIGVWCGGMLETGIGRAFNMALASRTNFNYPADMSPYNLYYKDDLIDPPIVLEKYGYIKVSNEVGLGYKVNDKKIAKYTLSKFIVD